jgi:hypothetical protein
MTLNTAAWTRRGLLVLGVIISVLGVWWLGGRAGLWPDLDWFRQPTSPIPIPAGARVVVRNEPSPPPPSPALQAQTKADWLDQRSAFVLAVQRTADALEPVRLLGADAVNELGYAAAAMFDSVFAGDYDSFQAALRSFGQEPVPMPVEWTHEILCMMFRVAAAQWRAGQVFAEKPDVAVWVAGGRSLESAVSRRVVGGAYRPLLPRSARRPWSAWENVVEVRVQAIVVGGAARATQPASLGVLMGWNPTLNRWQMIGWHYADVPSGPTLGAILPS